jgi:hypothetical protein
MLQGGFGEINVNRLSAAAAFRITHSPDCDISDANPWYTTRTVYRMPDLSDLPIDVAIASVQLVYQAACAGAAGSIIVGIETDTDAYVAATATSVVAVAGDVGNLTLADTKRETTQKSHGFPVHKAGENFVVTLTQGAGNTGDFSVQVIYLPIDPGI